MSVAAMGAYNNNPVGFPSNMIKGAVGGAIGAGAVAAAFKLEHGEIGAVAIGGAAVGIAGGAIGATAEFFGVSHKHASELGFVGGAAAGALTLKMTGALKGENALVGKPLLLAGLAASTGAAIMFGVFNHGTHDG